MKPDWLPDWDDENAYPKPKGLSWAQWTWQFLRRNPEYQKDYETWRALLDTLPVDRDRLPAWHADIRFQVFDPPSTAGETYEEYQTRVGRPRRYAPLSEVLPKKYGFRAGGPTSAGADIWQAAGLFPPEQEGFPGSFFSGDIRLSPDRTPPDRTPGVANDRFGGEVGEFEIWVSFNLEWPIDIQLRRAKQFLASHKSYLKKQHGLEAIEPRNQVNKFPYYLRLLDAEAAGVEVSTMAAVLLPDQKNEHPEYRASKNIRQGLVRAKRLRDRNYRFISLGVREMKGAQPKQTATPK